MDFKSAMFQANMLYGLEMLPEDFEELGLVAWNFIGNKKVRLYKFSAELGCSRTVELPCNADIIEAVTYGFEDWNYTTNDTPNGDFNSQFVESYIEGRKLFENPLYINGRYAKYERVGDTLYFDKDYGRVNILYKGVILDDEGLPDINDKESIAIATYCAYIKKYKEGLITNNPNIIQMAQLLEQKWYRYCDAARVPMGFSQNDMNEILDVKTSWDRKRYNKSYKPLH